MESGEAPVRVTIAHAHPVVRLGLRRVLGEAPGVVVASEPADTDAPPDVVVAGPPQVERALENGTPAAVLAVSPRASRASVTTLVGHGALGYVTTRAAPAQIARAVRHVAKGERWLGPRAVRAMALPPPGEDDADLTTREREVLGLLARGRSNREIAGALYVAEGTVKTHLRNLRRKLGAANRTHAVALAYERGLLPGA